MEHEEKLRDEYLKYYAYINSSGIHGLELQKALSDFWLAKRTSELQEIVREIEGTKVDFNEGNNIMASAYDTTGEKTIFIEGRNQAIDKALQIIKKHI